MDETETATWIDSDSKEIRVEILDPNEDDFILNLLSCVRIVESGNARFSSSSCSELPSLFDSYFAEFHDDVLEDVYYEEQHRDSNVRLMYASSNMVMGLPEFCQDDFPVKTVDSNMLHMIWLAEYQYWMEEIIKKKGNNTCILIRDILNIAANWLYRHDFRPTKGAINRVQKGMVLHKIYVDKGHALHKKLLELVDPMRGDSATKLPRSLTEKAFVLQGFGCTTDDTNDKFLNTIRWGVARPVYNHYLGRTADHDETNLLSDTETDSGD